MREKKLNLRNVHFNFIVNKMVASRANMKHQIGCSLVYHFYTPYLFKCQDKLEKKMRTCIYCPTPCHLSHFVQQVMAQLAH